MPGVAQPGIVGTRQDLSDIIFDYDAQETPYLSMVKKGEPPRAEVHQWQADKPAKASKAGKKDNDPSTAASAKTKDRRILETNSHWIDDPVSVGKKAETINEVAGIGQGRLMATEIAKSLKAVKTAVDQVLCDDQDQRDEGPQGSETRGLGSYIQTGAQSVRPVPEQYRTRSGAVYTGAFNDLTEEHVRDIVGEIFLQTGHSSARFQGIFGLQLKHKVSEWMVYQTNKTGMTPIRQVNKGIKDRVLAAVIDILEFDGGTVEIHLSRNLARNRYEEDEATATASQRRGYILDVDGCELKFAQNPMYEELPSDGGGKRGRVDTIFAHAVTPITQGKIAPGS
jgi:hypothetical protein